MDELITWIIAEIVFAFFGRLFKATWPVGKIKRYAAIAGVMFWVSLLTAIGLMVIGQVEMGLASFVFAFIFLVVALIYDAEEHQLRKQYRRERREAKRRLKVEEA